MDLVKLVKLKIVKKLGSSTAIRCMLLCQKEKDPLVRMTTKKVLKEKEKLLVPLESVQLQLH